MPSESKQSDAQSRAAPAPKPDDEDLEQRLGPIEDFQDRAESWMKEITSQVARLASGSESDTRRREALDKRLGDIEQRIQSLLTLTEMISMNENPFISGKEGGGGGGEPQAAAQAAPPQAAMPQEQSLYTPEAPQAAAHAPAESPAPAPAAQPASSHPNDASAEAETPHKPPEPDGSAEQTEPSEAEPPQDAHEAPFEKRPARPREAPPTPTPAPQADPSPPPLGRRLGPLVPVDEEPTDEAHTLPTDAPDPGRRAADRLFTLEWASMLARNLPRSEVPDFLDRYVEAGWVTRDMATRVRALALGLTQNDPEHPDQERLHELHLRTTVLLSHLDGAPLPADETKAVLDRARDLTTGEWVA